MSDPLPPDLAAALRRDRRAPRASSASRVYYFSETASTNDVAAALRRAGAPEGTTVVAGGADVGPRPPRADVVSRRRAPGCTCRSSSAIARGGAVPDARWRRGGGRGDPRGDRLAARDQVAERRRHAGRRRARRGAASSPASSPRRRRRPRASQHVVLGIGINLQPGRVSAGARRPRLVDRDRARAAVDAGPSWARSLAALAGRCSSRSQRGDRSRRCWRAGARWRRRRAATRGRMRHRRRGPRQRASPPASTTTVRCSCRSAESRSSVVDRG